MDKEEMKQKIEFYNERNKELRRKIESNEAKVAKLETSIEMKIATEKYKPSEIALLYFYRIYGTGNYQIDSRLEDSKGNIYDSITDYMKKHPAKKYGIVVSGMIEKNYGIVFNAKLENSGILSQLAKFYG